MINVYTHTLFIYTYVKCTYIHTYIYMYICCRVQCRWPTPHGMGPQMMPQPLRFACNL